MSENNASFIDLFVFFLRESQFKDVIVCFLRRPSWRRNCTFFCESQLEMKMYCWVGFVQRFLLEIRLEFVVHLLLFTYYTNREYATPLWFLASWDSWPVYDQGITLLPQSWSGAEPRRHTGVHQYKTFKQSRAQTLLWGTDLLLK